MHFIYFFSNEIPQLSENVPSKEYFDYNNYRPSNNALLNYKTRASPLTTLSRLTFFLCFHRQERESLKRFLSCMNSMRLIHNKSTSHQYNDTPICLPHIDTEHERLRASIKRPTTNSCVHMRSTARNHIQMHCEWCCAEGALYSIHVRFEGSCIHR